MRIEKRKPGFTIIELLIVIVVIGILAAIVIVAFNGIQRRAIEASLQSDVRNGATTAQNDATISGNFPANAAAVGSGAGLQSSGDNIMYYDIRPYGFCISATNVGTPNAYHVKSSDGQVQEGNCDPIVSTFAGTGASGFNNGAGDTAQFNYPWGIASDPSGNIFVADQGNHRIRKITPAGVVSTLVGSGTAGSVDGTGTGAQVNSPSAVASDSDGNIYVDSGTAIKKITPAGVLTSFAGSSSTSGYTDATGASARFTNIDQIAIDSSDTLYVADNNCIRKVTSAAVVTTLAGSCGAALSTKGYVNASGTTARFDGIKGIAVDSSGNVFVGDVSNLRVRKITPDGDVTTFAGSGVAGNIDGTGTAAQFDWPMGLTIDSNNYIYVADLDGRRIRKISPAGVVTTVAGSEYGQEDGAGLDAQFWEPMHVAADPSGNLYVADSPANKIRKILQ